MDGSPEPVFLCQPLWSPGNFAQGLPAAKQESYLPKTDTFRELITPLQNWKPPTDGVLGDIDSLSESTELEGAAKKTVPPAKQLASG